MDNPPNPRNRRRGIYGDDFHPILTRGFSVGSDEEDREASSCFFPQVQSPQEQGTDNTVSSPVEQSTEALPGTAVELEPEDQEQLEPDVDHEQRPSTPPSLAVLASALRRACSSPPADPSNQDLATRRARAYTDLIGDSYSRNSRLDSESSFLRDRESPWSFERRTESPDPELEPFPTYQDSEPEEWYPADSTSSTLLPSYPEACPQSQKSRDSSPGAVSSARVDFPNFQLPSHNTPTHFPVEEQEDQQFPLRKTRLEASKSFGQEYSSYGRKSSRDKAHKRSATPYYFSSDPEPPVPPLPVHLSSFPLPQVSAPPTLASASSFSSAAPFGQSSKSTYPHGQKTDLAATSPPSAPFSQPRKSFGVHGQPADRPAAPVPFTTPVAQPRKSTSSRAQPSDLATTFPLTPFGQPSKSSGPPAQPTDLSSASTSFDQRSRSREHSAREERPSEPSTPSSPLDRLPRSRCATDRVPEAAPVSETRASRRRPTREHRPTLFPSATAPYPPFSFETGRRLYDPLNFVPFGLDDNSSTDASTYRTPEQTVGRGRRKSEGSNPRPSFRKSSSSNADPTSSEKQHKSKKSGSSLASSIRKFFHSSKKSSKGETTAVFLSSSDTPDPQVEQVERDPFSPFVRRAPIQQRPALPPDFFPARPQPPTPSAEAVPGIRRTPFSPESSSPITSFPTSSCPVASQGLSATPFRIFLPENSSPFDTRPLPKPSSPTTPLPESFFPDRSAATMEPARASRFLDPAVMAITKQKAEAMRLAREQGAAIKEMCRRAKTDSPPYEFDELIGKGAYGRVYKGRQLPSGKLVAIKVMDIDAVDYKSIRDMKDESIKDFIHETKVMQQVKDAGAKNINMLIEAISIHSQLWLVCEYCPGGSVKTLMRATGDKLEERFIIPIARELAEGLRAIHDAGIIHRDVKAANILIHEEGRLQICDFGVAGILQSKLDKRSTWIGTPHWMPPEMFSNRGGGAHQYGSEIDVWAFGCTLYEFATGNPPNANLRERMQIGRQLNRVAPRLEGEGYSEGLKDLVSFSLNTEPQTRPSMGDILAHPYIQNSADGYPTSSLSDLVRIYYQWAQRGGQRISLFNPGGAAAAEFPGDNNSLDEDWNFSTTDGFEKRYSVIDLDQLSASLADIEREIEPTTKPRELGPFDDSPVAELTPEEKANFDERVKRGAAAMEGLFNEDMPSYKYETKNDFVPVEQKRRYSDLPLRTDTDRSSVTSTFIDLNLGAFDSSHYAAGSASNQPFQLADADTIRANRSSGRLYRTSSEEHSRTRGSDAGSDSQDNDVYQPQTGPRPPTMDWKFPAFMQPPKEDDNDKNESQRDEDGDKVSSSQDAQNDKRATMEWTFPVMTEEPESTTTTEAQDDLAATIRASQPPASHARDSSIGEPGDSESRPSTAVSTASTASDTEYDPFRFDRPQTPPGDSAQHGHFFDNELPTMMESAGYGDYEPSSVLDGPGPDHEDDHPAWQDNNSITDVPSYVEPFPSTLPSKDQNVKAPTSILPLTSLPPQSIPTARRAPPSTTRGNVPPVNFPNIQPPSAESLTAGADDSVVASELDRLLGDFLGAISAVGEAIGSVNVEPGSQNANAADNSRSE